MIDEKTENFATSCEKCVFAQWDVVDQTGCDLNRLDKYIDQKKASIKPNNNYFTIDTICNTCRGETWANHNLGRDLVTKVEEEIQISLSFILMSLYNEKDTIVRQLPKLVNNCINQKNIKPKQILLVVQNENIEYNEIYEILEDVCGEIQHKLIRVIDYTANNLKCLDIGVQKCTSRFYATFDLYSAIPINLIQTINSIINNNLQPLSMVKPFYELNGLIISTHLHRIFGGSKEFPIYEKIIEAAQKQNSTHHIYDWENLWINCE